MDTESKSQLMRLIQSTRVAALGTLRDGTPLVSMILFVPALDLSCFYTRASSLAQHTQDFLKDPHVSLMIAEVDDPLRDPQTLARVSIRGEVSQVLSKDPDFGPAQQSYLQKYPQAAVTFNLGDFSIYRISIKNARFVAGFGKTFNLKEPDFRNLVG